MKNGYSYEWINRSKNHILLKTVFGYNATRRTWFLSWFQACQRVRPPVLISQLQGHLQERRVIVLHFLQVRLLHQRHHQVIMRLEKKRIKLKVIPLQCLCQISMLMIERGNLLSALIQSRASSPSQRKRSQANHKNHVSSNMVFGHKVKRKTTCQSWFLTY